MYRFTVFIFFTVIISSCNQKEDNYFPSENWRTYLSVDQAGFSESEIAEAKKFSDSLGTASVLVLHKGNVLLKWGDATRRFRSTSIRKSLLNALIGIKICKEELSLDTLIDNFPVAESESLTPKERTATLKHLLMSASGIYLPASYEAQTWTDRKPERGSHNPGEFWYYNNWDFNSLGAIYETVSKQGIAQDFKTEIADKIGMQDYRSDLDFKYFAEPGVSDIPAYLFKMSSRDLARFGLLYLNNGKWNNQQLLSEKWVKESTTTHLNPWEGTGYGYLWWTTTLKDGSKAFYANGSGVQGIYVVPEKELVMVFRANSFLGPEIEDGQELILLEKILDAKKEAEVENPVFINTNWTINQHSFNENANTSTWNGVYTNPMIRKFSIDNEQGRTIMKTAIADFLIIPETDSTGWVEDLELPIHVYLGNQKKEKTSQLSPNGLIIYP